MVDLSDKDIKTVLRMLKEPKEDMDKVKKTIYEQNLSINKKTNKPERKF